VSPQEVTEIVDRIRPLLAGRDPRVQGAVCADLTAIWLAGHPKELRDDLLAAQIDTIKSLTVINAEIMGTDQ